VLGRGVEGFFNRLGYSANFRFTEFCEVRAAPAHTYSIRSDRGYMLPLRAFFRRENGGYSFLKPPVPGAATVARGARG
jgi:hypothetical protein